METVLVSDYRKLRLRIRELAREHRDAKFAFRGQIAFHNGAVIPSIMRTGHADYQEVHHPLWYTLVSDMVFSQVLEYQKWLRSRGQDRKPVVESETETPEAPKTSASLGSQIERLLQHYGARSNYVDVTSSLTVALWFAHHAHNMHDLPLLPADVPDLDESPDPFGPMRVYDIAWYERAWPKAKVGYLFVLAPNIPQNPGTLRHGDYIDLLPNVMSLRIDRQRAGLIFAENTVDSGDLSKFVLRVFEFRLPLKGAPRFVTQAKTSTLFPSPDKDLTYGDLLDRIPFQTDLNAPFSVRRIVRIPEYYDKFLSQGSAAWRAYRKRDTYRFISLLFPMLMDQNHSSVVCQAGGADVHLKHATPLLCPLSISFVMDPASADDFTLAPHGDNLFLEYDPIRGGVIAETPIAPSDPRGIWIVSHGKHIWCRLFAKSKGNDEQVGIAATFGHWFAFENGTIVLVGDPAEEGSDESELIDTERELLGLALSLLWDVRHERRKLISSPLPPYLMFSEELIAFS